MKPLLNTLYVTTQGAYLARDGETVLVRVEKETRLQVPIHTLSSIVCFEQVSCSPPLLGLCSEKGVALSHLTENGQFLAKLQGPMSGNVLLRRAQYRLSDREDHGAPIARSIVIGKVANSRIVLLRGAREKPDAPGAPELEQAAQRLGRLLEDVERTACLD